MARCKDCGHDYADLFEGRCKWCHGEYQRKIEAAERRRQEAEDRRQREFLQEMDRQQRAAEERMVEMEKERERRADPQRWYGSEWVEHLKLHPEDTAKCRWASLKGDDVCNLLMHDPSYDVKCNLDLLSDESWGKLFASKEVLVDKYLPKFDQKKIVKILCNLSRLKGPPQWVKRVALDKLSPIDKGKVLVHNNMCWYPFIGERFGSLKDLPVDDKAVLMTYSEEYHTLPGFDDWSIYSVHQQALIVRSYPKCAGRLDFSKVSAEDLTELLKKRPELISFCGEPADPIKRLSEAEKVEILNAHPDLVANSAFSDWLKYSESSIELLLKKFNGALSPSQWAEILRDVSLDASTFPAERLREFLLKEFDGGKWVDFLSEYSGSYRWMTSDLKTKILCQQAQVFTNPHFSDLRDYSKEEVETFLPTFETKFSAKQWAEILKDTSSNAPTFLSERLGSFLLKEFDGEMWIDFLKTYSGAYSFIKDWLVQVDVAQLTNIPLEKLIPVVLDYPALEKRMQWSEETLSMFDWGKLTDDQRVEFAIGLKQKQYVKYPLSLEFDPNKLRPWCLDAGWYRWPERFVAFKPDQYDWTKFTPKRWASFLWDHPEFKKYCDVERYDWRKLADEGYCYKLKAIGACPEGVLKYFTEDDWNYIETDETVADGWAGLLKRQPALRPYYEKYGIPKLEAEKKAAEAEQVEEKAKAERKKKETEARAVAAKKAARAEARNKVGAFLKKHWMPILAVLLMLGAFNGGGFWSFLIGAGLGIYWWKNRD